MKYNKQKFRKVKVIWVDSHSISGWQFNIPKANLKCVSVGYLVKKKKKSIVLAQSLSEDCLDNLFYIPKCSIISMENLK